MEHSDVLKLKNKFFKKKIDAPIPVVMESQIYRSGMYSLCNLLLQNISVEDNLMVKTDTINRYFVGELRENLLSENFRKTFSSNQKEVRKDKNLQDWISTYNGKMQNQIYNDYILYNYNKYEKMNAYFPKEILAEKVVSLNDSSVISIRELLQKTRGELAIIDHWATWCGGCIAEIVKGKENTKKLEQDGIKFIYLSLDKANDYEKTRTKALELGIADKSYILIGNFNTKYVKYLNISFIPRYTLVGKNGKLLSEKILHPRDLDNIEKIKLNIKQFEE